MEYLKLKDDLEIPSIKHILTIDSDKSIGCFLHDNDGFYYFDCHERTGLWAAYILREIADKLDILNKDWEDEINSYFKLVK